MADRNVEEIKQLFDERAALGIKKYGRTTDSGYSRLEMLKHLREELMDGAIYITELIRQEDDKSS